MIELQSQNSNRKNIDWEQFLSDMHATLARLREANAATHLYALVDTRGLPDVREALERLDSIAFSSLWNGTDLSAFKDIAPLLIRIDLQEVDGEIPRQLLKRLWRFSQDGFMLTWIWSPYEIEGLAGHFWEYCEYTLPDRKAFYLHFYDNRILERLRCTWTPEEWNRFASVCFELRYRQRSGEETVWRAEELLSLRRGAPLQLTEEQHSKLLSLGVADKLSMQLIERLGARIEHLSSVDLYLAVHGQMERAISYGIVDEKDMLRYVTMGLLLSPKFDERPPIRSALESAKYGDVSFGEVLSRISEDAGDGQV